jgi:hypothetical protein
LATAEIIPLFHPATFWACRSLCILSINPVPPGLFRIIRRFYLLHLLQEKPGSWRSLLSVSCELSLSP